MTTLVVRPCGMPGCTLHGETPDVLPDLVASVLGRLVFQDRPRAIVGSTWRHLVVSEPDVHGRVLEGSVDMREIPYSRGRAVFAARVLRRRFDREVTKLAVDRLWPAPPFVERLVADRQGQVRLCETCRALNHDAECCLRRDHAVVLHPGGRVTRSYVRTSIRGGRLRRERQVDVLA